MSGAIQHTVPAAYNTTANKYLTIIKPITITDAVLTGSSVPETDYPVYSTATTYTASARVVFANNDKLYESLQGSNTNHSPDEIYSAWWVEVADADYSQWLATTTYSYGDRCRLAATHKVYESVSTANVNKNPTTATTAWLEASSSNRWKMFDLSNATFTREQGSIYVTLAPGVSIDSIVMLNAFGGVVTMSKVEGTATTTLLTASAESHNIRDSTWYNYFFDAVSNTVPAIFYTNTGAAFSTTASYVISIVNQLNTEAMVGCSGLVLGTYAHIGLGVEAGMSLGIIDYSRKTTDDFGNITLIQRAFAKTMNINMLLDANDIDTLIAYLTTIRAVPCVFIANSDFNDTILYGFYRDFSINIAYPEYSECSMQIEGLS